MTPLIAFNETDNTFFATTRHLLYSFKSIAEVFVSNGRYNEQKRRFGV